MIETLLALMLNWKADQPEPRDERLARYRELVTQIYAQCKRYEERTKVSAEMCTAIAANTAYWETGLQKPYQLLPKNGPSGEECYFQIHRQAQSIPFPEWKLAHKYGTRHGEDISRCVEDGVRIVSYHLWRCGFTGKKIRGGPKMHLWWLYGQYYKPGVGRGACRVLKGGPVLVNRAEMGARLIRKMKL